MKMTKFVALILFFLISFFYILCIRDFGLPTVDRVISEQKNRKKHEIVPIILGWNNFHYFGNVITVMTGLDNVDECPLKCQYSSDKNLYLNASAIVFYIRVEHGQLPARRLANQLYTFYLDEPPNYTFGLYKHLPPNFFNLTMTYRADSDIFFPYDRFVPLNSHNEPDEFWTEEQLLERISKKTKLALQVNSDCETPSKREKLVEELHHLLNVSLYGKCLGGKYCDWDHCYNRELESHFFYLAMENNLCKDYVTEKFWNVKRLIVPVVLSRRIFHGLEVPSGSYIAADDFRDAKELANFLAYLQKNRTAYLSYFTWTKAYRKTHYHSLRSILSKKYHQTAIIARNPSPSPDFNPLCALCQLVHLQHRQGHPKKMIENIWQWWEGQEVCIPNFVDLWHEGKAKQAFDEAKWPEDDG